MLATTVSFWWNLCRCSSAQVYARTSHISSQKITCSGLIFRELLQTINQTPWTESKRRLTSWKESWFEILVRLTACSSTCSVPISQFLHIAKLTELSHAIHWQATISHHVQCFFVYWNWRSETLLIILFDQISFIKTSEQKAVLIEVVYLVSEITVIILRCMFEYLECLFLCRSNSRKRWKARTSCWQNRRS